MTKQTIELDVPDDFEVSSILDMDENNHHVIVYLRKKPPRRRVFECVSEEPSHPKNGDWYESLDNALIPYSDRPVAGKYKIFKEVTE